MSESDNKADNKECTCPQCDPTWDSTEHTNFMRELGRRTQKRMEEAKKQAAYIEQLINDNKFNF